MANQGFRGTEVLFTRLSIESSGHAPTLQVSVQFAGDGVVHAICEHAFPIADDDALQIAVLELVKLVTKKVEAIHFAQPNDAPGEVLQGIAETLRQPPKSPDEPGTQG